MKIILLLLILALLCVSVTARLKCPGVPYNGAVATCYHGCGMKLIYDLCIKTMQQGHIDLSPSHKEETTAYAILVLSAAVESTWTTSHTLTYQLQKNASISVQERAFYGACLTDYVAALNSLDHTLVVMLPNCFFQGINDDYLSALASLNSCRDRFIGPAMYTSPVYPLVLADRNKALLAYSLGKLLS
ncbi:hypothetical protein TRIUR3_04069 [Triticum urartu]|uniref:Pectinesterase inhibitor domain-containing protein n=2 Tax=Triticum urartu TaxID=4572 RepID=M8AW14_TRIUA|nr:uncharacterized protein LOC125528182 [Triticum urartu]EMS65254.1 hypothetical protein TRIUR3_04069 [Triticum urartu]